MDSFYNKKKKNENGDAKQRHEFSSRKKHEFHVGGPYKKEEVLIG